MTFWLVLLATFLMWVMWICAFMHQMYPLARPTVPKPIYRVRCATDEICRKLGQTDCNNITSDYYFSNDTKLNCTKCLPADIADKTNTKCYSLS